MLSSPGGEHERSNGNDDTMVTGERTRCAHVCWFLYSVRNGGIHRANYYIGYTDGQMPNLRHGSRRPQANVEVHRKGTMGDRAWLKQTVYRAHIRSYGGGGEVRCPWCLGIITKQGGADLHEALVHRGAVPRDKQGLIFVKENAILVHHDCHIEQGQTQEMEKRCLWALCKAIGARYVGRWYKSLWSDSLLSVKKGMLMGKKEFKVYQVITFLELGATLDNWKLPDESEWALGSGRHTRDYRALAAKRWQGKTIKKIDRPPPEWAGMKLVMMIQIIEDGYWFDYLSGVFGLVPQEVVSERTEAEAGIREI